MVLIGEPLFIKRANNNSPEFWCGAEPVDLAAIGADAYLSAS
jgi:hypothetical protein